MNTVGQDLRYSLRTLRKSPGLAAAAVGILALEIGANTALFSVVDAVLRRPLPFPEPGRMMRLQEAPPPPAESGKAVSPANYFDWWGWAKKAPGEQREDRTRGLYRHLVPDILIVNN
jgi:hypothetical protein